MTGTIKFTHSDLTQIIKAHLASKYNLATYNRKITFGIVLDGIEHPNVVPTAEFTINEG